MGSHVIFEKKGKVAIITLNMPNKMNSFEKPLRDDFKAALEKFRDDKESSVAIITGEGKAFCAGGSLEELKEGNLNALKGVSYMKIHNELILLLNRIGKPIIAAVNGVAVGAGFSLALACDIILASTNARFGQVFANVGLVPDMGSTYFLPRAVGMHRAKELIFTAKLIKAEEAQNLGIVNYVVGAEELMALSLELATKIADGPGFAFALGKEILSKSLESNLEDMLDKEGNAQCLCFESQDHKEGVNAFYEKRAPKFTGK
jgi:2-(1,2-epoxy-1,2-dihydrophenyl)acetyl-CoA isomerase